PAMPEGGQAKFYDQKTGAYNWEAHAKDAEYRAKQKTGDKSAEGDTEKSGGVDNAAEKSEAETKTAIESLGLDLTDLRNDLAQNGEIAAERREKLVEAFGEDIVADYEGFYKAAIELAQYKAIEYVGGQDALQEIINWGEANLSEDEKNRYNEMLAGADWQVALDSITARMGKSRRTHGEATLIDTDSSGNGDGGGFASQADMVKAMSDPRYDVMSLQYDPAYVRM